MNFNKDLWEKVEPKEFGEYEALELGGHEIVILDAREHTSEFSGNTSLKISVDIAGNDKQAGFFKKQYDEDTRQDKKWPNGAVRYVSLKDEQIEYLKGFITSLENSNPNFKFNTNGTWEQLKGLKCAGQFGLEQYEKQDGTFGFATRLLRFRSLNKLSEIEVPKVRFLDGSSIDYEEYKEVQKISNQNQKTTQNNEYETGMNKVIEDNMLD